MRAELRADGLHISGYVNIPGRMSRPVMTPHGRVVEVIEQRAFARAIERADNIQMLLDHDHNRELASTRANTLTVKEDAVGLRAESVVTDPEVIEGARAGKLRGWSFDIKNPKDTMEERADGLPIIDDQTEPEPEEPEKEPEEQAIEPVEYQTKNKEIIATFKRTVETTVHFLCKESEE